MQTKNVNAVRVIRLKLKVGEAEEIVPIHLTMEGELLGANNIQVLRDWLAGKEDYTQPAPVSQPITQEYRRDLRFFTSAPCWFEGCEELRASYQKELDDLKAANCKSCEKAPLMQKYLKLVAEAQQP